MGETKAATKLQSVAPFIKDGRVGTVLAVATMAATIWEEFKPVVQSATSLVSHTVRVTEKDEIWEEVEAWVLSFLKKKSVKKTRLRLDSSATDRQKPMHFGKTIRFRMAGAKVRAYVWEEDRAPAERGNRAPSPSYIQFDTYSKDAYFEVIDKLISMFEDQKTAQHTPKLFTPTSWGGFRRREIPVRTLNSVILKENEISDLVADLRNFLSSEQRYNELGVPWHRGYLLYGVAGTGKTSIAKALSAEFGLDVYTLSLGDLDSDNTLNDYVENIRPRSVLLLEDVDVFSAATSREAEERSASLSGLLNVLDGIATPHGLITVLTTNHIEELDEALIRPGRIDVQKKFTELDQSQGERLFEHFYGYCPEGVSFEGLLPSAVTSMFVQHLESPDDALKAVMELRNFS